MTTASERRIRELHQTLAEHRTEVEAIKDDFNRHISLAQKEKHSCEAEIHI